MGDFGCLPFTPRNQFAYEGRNGAGKGGRVPVSRLNFNQIHVSEFTNNVSFLAIFERLIFALFSRVTVKSVLPFSRVTHKPFATIVHSLGKWNTCKQKP